MQDLNIAKILPIIFGEKQNFSLKTGEQVESEFSTSTEGCDAYFKMPDGTEIDTHVSEALFSKKEKSIYIRSDIYERSFILQFNTATVNLISDCISEMEECTA